MLCRSEFRSNTNLKQGHDTVGAVCLDAQGNVAYATSTGGINAKLPGRVGDSPLIGKSNNVLEIFMGYLIMPNPVK